MAFVRFPVKAAAAAALAGVTLFALYACVGSDATTPPTTPSGDDATITNDSGNPNTNPTDAGSDAGTDAADAANGFCATLAPTPGAADFFCADFDESADASTGWTSEQSFDGGTVAITTDVETSKPNAISAQPPAGDPVSGGPSLTWTATGAKAVTQVVATAAVNPTFIDLAAAYTGMVKYIQITTTDAQLAFGYTRGASVFSLTGTPMSNYTGYVLFQLTSGGAAQLITYALPSPTGQLTPSIWTTVALTYVTSGHAKLTYNNIAVFDQGMYATTQTTANVILGGVASGQTKIPEVVRFDDVFVSTTRAP